MARVRLICFDTSASGPSYAPFPGAQVEPQPTPFLLPSWSRNRGDPPRPKSAAVVQGTGVGSMQASVGAKGLAESTVRRLSCA